MSNPNHPLQFDLVIAQLEQWRDDAKDELRAPITRENALELKRQLDVAVECLEFCQRYQIRPTAHVTVLPPTQTRTPSSEYRVMEDHESENREDWTEVEVDGRQFRPGEGDIILSDIG